MTVERVRGTQPRGHVSRGIAARVAQIGVMFLVIGVVLFGSAGRLDWVWGWVYLAIYLASTLVNAWFFRRDPELVAERGQPGAMPGWDKAPGGLWSLAQFVLLPLVAGLDVRFGWTGPFDVVWHLAGVLLFAAGLALFGWAMIANAYFSTVARVQPERGQTVCNEGPYRVVRHPGYAGAILQSSSRSDRVAMPDRSSGGPGRGDGVGPTTESIGSPFLLGSVWALLPAVAAGALMAARTSFEDRMLLSDLPGYDEYVRHVPHRLLPGVW